VKRDSDLALKIYQFSVCPDLAIRDTLFRISRYYKRFTASTYIIQIQIYCKHLYTKDLLAK
jgi:hypothetical protein